VVFLSSVAWAGSLESAYETYLEGSFEKSYQQYADNYESTGNRDALYGMINSLVMLKRYDEALLLCHTDEHDAILLAKEVWILGLGKNRAVATTRMTTIETVVPQESRPMIFRSGGDGFYGSGEFKEAIRWYEKAQKIAFDSATQRAITAATIEKKTAVLQTVSAMGGPIIYSKGEINDQKNQYRYDHGSFLSAGTRLNVKKRFAVELEYCRFDASFGENVYGVSYESQLYKSRDSSANMPWPMLYTVQDSVDHWVNENPETHKYSIVDSLKTYKKFNGVDTTFTDSIWTLYSESYISDSDTASYDDTVSFVPTSIFQNGIYAGFSVFNAFGRRLTMVTSANLWQSNMANMNRGASLGAYGGFNGNYLTIGSYLYGTFTEKVGTIQVSPDIGGTVKLFSWNVTPSSVFKTGAPVAMKIPGVQLSAEVELGVTGKHGAVSVSGVVGKRAFTAESSGKNVVTITLPHRFSGSFYGAVMPGSGRLSLFTLWRYENYEQLSRLIALGGTTFSF